MTLDKKQLLRIAGWSAIAAGIYMVHLGSIDEVVTRIRPDDDVIDAEFTVVED